MPFGDKGTLQAHFSNENFISAIDEPRFLEIQDQVSNLIYQKTTIAPPATVASAPGILRLIWADIVVFEIIPYQKDISDEEKTRRTTKFKTAMKLLDEIANGDLIVLDANGNPLGASTTDSLGDVNVVSGFGKRVNCIP